MAQNLWFPREFKESFGFEGQKWVQAVIDRLAGTGDNAATLRNLFNDNTILKADADNTPEALDVTEQTLVGRATGGQIAALSPAQAKGILGIDDLTVAEDAAISTTLSFSNMDFEGGDLSGWTTSNGPPTIETADPVLGHTLPSSWGTYYVKFGTGLSIGEEVGLSRSFDISDVDEAILVAIDAGRATFTLQWDQISLQNLSIDAYEVNITFKDSGGSTLDTLSRPENKVPGTVELGETLSQTFPVGTRTIDVEFICHNDSGGTGGEYTIDNVEIQVTAPKLSVSPVDTIVVDSGKLTDDGSGQVTLDLSGTTLTVEESDGAPSVTDIRRIIVTNGTLTDNGSGEIALDLTGTVSGGGGLVLEATDTADGTSESLQVSMTSTPADVDRLVFYARDIVPEIDFDLLYVTVILDDDSELTSAVYDVQFLRDASNLSPGSVTESSGASSVEADAVGNGTGESSFIRIEMVSQNGSNDKWFEFYQGSYSASGQRRYTWGVFNVTTTSGIKGFRIDTDNAGDMIDEGVAQIWVQT